MFVVPNSNSKNVDEMKFHIDYPMLNYCQSTSNSYCLSSLVPEFDSINQIKAFDAISKHTE